MGKSKAKGGKSNKGKGGGKAIKQSRKAVKMAKPQVDAYVRSYLQMLNDPCSATPVTAPYIGTEAGYLCRTVDILRPSFANSATAGTTVYGDFITSYCPSYSFNTSSGTPIVYGNCGFGLSATTAVQRPTNFVTNGGTVGKYRAVAACLKYVPTGAFGSRSGEIGIGYNPDGHFIASGSSITAAAAMPLTQFRGGNGTAPFEVKWLPSAADQTWVDLSASAESFGGGASIFIVGINVDATEAAGGAGAYINGYIEITTIWEWLPLATQGLSMPLKSPSRHTLNDVLSTIKDIGTFVVGGMKEMNGYGLLSAGWKVARRAAPALLTM